MSFIKKLTDKCYLELVDQFTDTNIVSTQLVSLESIDILSKKLLKDLNLSLGTDIETIESDLWNWYDYMLHKGIAAAIAARYGRNNIDLNYSFEDAKSGYTPVYNYNNPKGKFEYSYNLKYYLNKYNWKFEEIFNNVLDFIKDSKELIAKEEIDINYVILTFLSYGGLVGVYLTNRIELTKEDYWTIRPFLIINESELSIDEDLLDIVNIGNYDVPFIENKDSIFVRCSFCGHTVLDLEKTGKNWGNAVKDSCDHFGLVFVSNTSNQLFGREYYYKAFKRSVIDYVETFKRFTCQNAPEKFINDFLNGDTDLNNKDMELIIKILKSEIPDYDLQIKHFQKLINKRKHVFLFHFIKFHQC